MNKNIIIVIGVIIVAVGYSVFSGKNSQTNEMVQDTVSVEQMSDQEARQAESSYMPSTIGETSEVAPTTSVGSYVAYSADKIALAETGDVVLFFHAAWCPSCRGLNNDIEKNLSAIPAGVTILKVDYDKETELKKKYGVTTQHTLVQVDKDGNLIKKWSGGSKLENLLSQIQ